MAGYTVTSDEIARAQAYITDRGATIETMGRENLARGLGMTSARARTILDKLRHGAGQVSQQIGTVLTSETRLDDKRLEMENAHLRAKLNEALSRQVLDQRYQEFMAEVAGAKREYPKWTLETKRGKHTAMPVAHLSDWHFDEVVDPKQIGFANGYNREIAVKRLRRFFAKTIDICDSYLKGVDYPGIVVPVSGDMFSGNIHQELRETNEAPITESLRFWLDEMEVGIGMLAERFGRVFLPWVVGNHPRLTQKPIAKSGPTDNFDWLLGSLLQRDFARAKDTRVQFQIADAFDNYFRIFDTRYCQTHGDQFRGGKGISGMATPLALGDARKRKRAQSIKLPYHFLIIGHLHQRDPGRVVKTNGCGKGFDEYAFKSNFDCEPPQQSFWLDTPEHRITLEMPIYVKTPNEGWERKQTEQQAVFEAVA